MLAKLNAVAMPTTCAHTWLHKPEGDASLGYTASWLDSPEVNKLVVRAGLHTLTAGKYLISPGNTQHQGCDDLLSDQHTQTCTWKPRKYQMTTNIFDWSIDGYSGPSSPHVRQGLESSDTHTHTPSVSTLPALLLFPPLACLSPTSPPGQWAVTLALQLL